MSSLIVVLLAWPGLTRAYNSLCAAGNLKMLETRLRTVFGLNDG
jgi:hypothetical protein